MAALAALAAMDLPFLQPLQDLWQDEQVRAKLEETAKFYYSNANLSVDLYPYFLWGGLLLIGGFFLFEALSGSELGASGYGVRSDQDAILDLQAQVAALQDSQAALTQSYGGYDASAYAGYDVAGANSVGYSA